MFSVALDERYVLLFDLESTLRDKDSGLPLSDGFIYSYRDDSRNTPKTLYQLSGSPGSYTYTALPNPVPLSGIGVPQNALGDNVAIYMYPYITDASGQEVLDLYYLSIKSSAAVEQFTRSGWPNLTAGGDPTQNSGLIENELSNPQFSRVLINSGATTFTFAAASAQEIPIAPDWTLIVSGTGTIIVEQVALAGNDDIITHPAYALEITVSSGITACRLNQRLYNNSGLWANTYLAGSFVAKSVGGTGYGVSMYYAESTPTTSTLIASAALTTTFVRYAPSPVLTPSSGNTETSATGYVDIYLSLSASTKVQITSVQVIPTQEGDVLPYDARSSNRELAMMSDYYTPRLIEKAIPSLLTGWDFPLNPRQFGTTPTITGTAAYIYDQTIAIRSAGNMTTATSAVTGGLEVTTGTATDAFYLLQYLSGAQAKKMLGTSLSVNIAAYKGTVGANVTARVYLYRGNAASSIPTLGTTIGTLAATGVFTLTAANWTEIPRSNLGTATGTLPLVTTATSAELDTIQDLGFSGWEITTTSELADTDKFAIVVTFQVPTDLTIVTVNSISLVPGDIPTRPAPQTPDEVLRECQYYYESSFAPGTAVPTATFTNGLIAQQYYTRTGTDNLFAQTFEIIYRVPKRTAPTTTLYSGSSTTAARVEGYLVRTGSTVQTELATSAWTPGNAGVNSIVYVANTGTAVYTPATVAGGLFDGYIGFHYLANAQLGIV